MVLSKSAERLLVPLDQQDEETTNWNLKMQNIANNGLKDLKNLTGKELYKLSGELYADIKRF